MKGSLQQNAEQLDSLLKENLIQELFAELIPKLRLGPDLFIFTNCQGSWTDSFSLSPKTHCILQQSLPLLAEPKFETSHH
jgi:hypothetical protein